jgi:hypothetical protein
MKVLDIAVSSALLVFAVAGFSQTNVSCGQTLDAPLRSSAVLAIDSRPAGIEIVATNEEAIHVSCTAEDMSAARDVRLQLSGTATHAKLTVKGDHLKHGDLKIRIAVPRKVNLEVQMPAGEVKVNDIVGDKDIELHAGQVTIVSAHAWDYKSIDVSVTIGQVNAEVYGTQTGGFFRSFRKDDPNGEYRLKAHVATGQIDLSGADRRSGKEAQ